MPNYNAPHHFQKFNNRDDYQVWFENVACFHANWKFNKSYKTFRNDTSHAGKPIAQRQPTISEVKRRKTKKPSVRVDCKAKITVTLHASGPVTISHHWAHHNHDPTQVDDILLSGLPVALDDESYKNAIPASLMVKYQDVFNIINAKLNRLSRKDPLDKLSVKKWMEYLETVKGSSTLFYNEERAVEEPFLVSEEWCIDSTQKRYDWVVRWSQTDMDYMSNCAFIDEAAFHINLKRTMAWSEKGTRAEVIVPQTRAKTTTILGATSVWGVLNVQVRLPGTSNKKRKLAGTSSGKATTVGTVTGHYFNFVAKTIDIMDQHEQFKDFYLIMDNAPIHTAKDIERYIIQRGYRCVYLPPYSPELNPIEQFWHVVKSKLKRENLLKTETLSARITDACNEVLFSDLEGSARYSVKKFDVCLAKEPL
ncbi:hypothetical protein INT47_003141 [Mucor saturninus]|uniref:Tc1-like transposase DDE domain-containing protein n=1 Tax=Mucor saturninus TaxID=64648 RepID=A0A8H7QY69_9FUNG|nr:hypothetical protein INT47_003141 [Mucor saturninus]